MTLTLEDWKNCKEFAETELKQIEIDTILCNNKLALAEREILRLEAEEKENARQGMEKPKVKIPTTAKM